MTTSDKVTDSVVSTLNDHFGERCLLPGDDEYGEAIEIWNGMIEKYPSIVVRCQNTDDVVAALNAAKQDDLPFSVKAGGHSAAGKALRDDGMVIDLGPMDRVEVDANAKTAVVGPGARWGDFDTATQEHGLATTGGVDSRTGVAGLTLGGGIGWLARSFGLACDNLRRVEVVTASGEIVTASPDEHSDLFWAVRGGGGNFGIVTEFEFQLHDVGPEVLVAQAFHPFGEAVDLLSFYRDFMDGAPDEVGCYAFILPIPPVEPFPEEYHGKTAAALIGCYSGDIDEGEAAFEPVVSHGDPIVSFAQPMPYTEFQQSFDDGYPNGERFYGKSAFIEGISDELIHDLVDVTDPLPGPMTGVFFECMGGAVADVDANETAFPHRDAPYNLAVTCGWSDPTRDEEIMSWAERFEDTIIPYSTGGVYVNYLDRNDDDKMRGAYRGNYDRLIEVKRRWDPDNRFDANPHLIPGA